MLSSLLIYVTRGRVAAEVRDAPGGTPGAFGPSASVGLMNLEPNSDTLTRPLTASSEWSSSGIVFDIMIGLCLIPTFRGI